jgi:hypothetical protein
MNKSMTKSEFVELAMKSEGGTEEHWENQWNLYWNGVRDIRLSDFCIVLIDTFGF